jgi:hypothetical protein
LIFSRFNLLISAASALALAISTGLKIFASIAAICCLYLSVSCAILAASLSAPSDTRMLLAAFCFSNCANKLADLVASLAALCAFFFSSASISNCSFLSDASAIFAASAPRLVVFGSQRSRR